MAETMKAAWDPLVLGLLEQQPDHGYSLVLRIRGQFGLDVSDGSLYPSLFRLEKAGKIEGKWETSESGRQRKVFHLTPKGRQTLKKARAQWPQLAQAYDRIFGRALVPNGATE